MHRKSVAGWAALTIITLACGGVTVAQDQKHPNDEQKAKAEKQEGKPATVTAAPATQPALPMCPVMNEPINFAVKTMTEQGPVYFCCEMCIGKYEKDPAKYEKQVAEQRRLLAQRPRIQVSCPVSGKPASAKSFIERDGKKVYFCCDDCKPKYEAAPAKFAAKLADSYTYQTRCPVSGEQIDPATWTDLPTGQRIYLCCKGCEKALLADPAKYAPRLEEQGMPIDVKKLQAAKEKEPTKEKP